MITAVDSNQYFALGYPGYWS